MEYKFKDEGKKVKTTTTLRVVKRRSWLKFGDAAEKDANSSHVTMRSAEDIILQRIRAPGFKAEEAKPSRDSTVLMVCRLCHVRGDHWTARCPQKDVLSLIEERPVTAEACTAETGTGEAAYVPPNMRGGAVRRDTGSEMRRRNNENSVRVTNLSEDTREPDLMELFCPFGAVTRAYVGIDQKKSVSRGFRFDNFVSQGRCRASYLQIEWLLL